MQNTICINEIYLVKKTGESYRVLWLAPDLEYGYWISMGKGNKMPVYFECVEVQEGVQNNEICLIPESASVNMENTGNLGDYEERWNLFRPVLEREPDIYDKGTRSGIIVEFSSRTGMKTPNIYKYMIKYWKNGKTPDAFKTNYYRCGRSARKDTGTRLGSPVKHEGGFGKVLTDEDRKKFKSAVNKYYLSRKKLSLEKTYEKLLEDHYSYEVENPSGIHILKLMDPDQIPSKRQFRYWYDKNKDLKKESQKRSGEAKFELNERGITGRSDYQLMGPGAKYQIDATIGDIYLVSQFDRSNIIGRPVMYFVIDAYSRIVTGMYVGLEGPSWAGAMMALENATCDKVSYCSSFGISISEEEWPCHHLPSAILGDRGEMESHAADNLVQMLGVRIENAPPYRADLKGIVEQHFRTINTTATPLLPGKVLPDMKERGGHDYRLDAKLDIRQFTALIIRCVLYYNNHHHMEYFEKSEQMMKLGVEAVPVELWNFGIRYCSGGLRTASRETVRMALMPSAKASVTERGLRFKGLYYTSEKAVRDRWFEKARNGGSYKVRVQYDPRDAEALFAQDPADGEMMLFKLVDWEKKYSGKQLDEVAYEQEKEKHEHKKRTVKETEAKINLNSQIDKIVKEAEMMTPADKTESKAARIGNIRDNRKAEKENLRKKEAFTASTDQEAVVTDSQKEEPAELSPIMRMLQAQLEEQIKDDPIYKPGKVPGADDT